jgi:hypothetical protein
MYFCVHIRKLIGFAYLLGLCQMVLGGASTADDSTREGRVVDSWILEMWCASLTQARPRVWWPVSGARVHARAVALSSHWSILWSIVLVAFVQGWKKKVPPRPYRRPEALSPAGSEA